MCLPSYESRIQHYQQKKAKLGSLDSPRRSHTTSQSASQDSDDVVQEDTMEGMEGDRGHTSDRDFIAG